MAKDKVLNGYPRKITYPQTLIHVFTLVANTVNPENQFSNIPAAAFVRREYLWHYNNNTNKQR